MIVANRPRSSRKCRHTGLCQSCCRWLSQQVLIDERRAAAVDGVRDPDTVGRPTEADLLLRAFGTGSGHDGHPESRAAATGRPKRRLRGAPTERSRAARGPAVRPARRSPSRTRGAARRRRSRQRSGGRRTRRPAAACTSACSVPLGSAATRRAHRARARSGIVGTLVVPAHHRGRDPVIGHSCETASPGERAVRVTERRRPSRDQDGPLTEGQRPGRARRWSSARRDPAGPRGRGPSPATGS